MRRAAEDDRRYRHLQARPYVRGDRPASRPGPRRDAGRGQARALPLRLMSFLRVAVYLCLLSALPALAQTWPARPVHVIVPFAAGGSVDIVARLLGQRLGDELGQPFIVENKGGAGGTIAANQVAKAPGDGYTLMIMHQGLAFNASLYANLPYDTLRDLVAIAYVGATPNALVVTDALPVNTPQEFI